MVIAEAASGERVVEQIGIRVVVEEVVQGVPLLLEGSGSCWRGRVGGVEGEG